jgi:hypothetical protein
MYFIAAGLGAACAVMLMVSGLFASHIVPEWMAQLGWLVLITAASVACGHRWPEGAWRLGAIVIGVQPVCAFVVFAAVGELQQPASSTGGMVAVVAFAFMAALVSPLPILASHIAGRARLKARASSGTQPGGST